MRRRWIGSIFASCALTAVSSTEPPLLREARQARAESIPQVAIPKLRAFLAAGDLPADQRRAANSELAAALLDAGELEEALQVAEPLAKSGEKSDLLRHAEILSRVGRWSEAFPEFQALSSDPTVGSAAQLGAAEAWHALGQLPNAIEALEGFVAAHPRHVGARLRLAGWLVDAGKLTRARELLARSVPQNIGEGKWRKYVEGRLLLASDQAAPALALFEEILQDLRSVSESLLFGATLGSMEARGILNGYQSADGLLEKFISRYPNSPYLEAAFQRLDQIYEQEDHPSDNELKKQAQKPPSRRTALAQYYLARLYRRLKKPEKANALLETFVQNNPAHALLPAVHLLQADDALEKAQLPTAVRALEAAMRQARTSEERAAIELRTALVQYRQGEALLAANSFRRAAQSSEKLREYATFDAALADLSLRNYERFFEDYRALSTRFPNSPLRGSLVLEQGFAQARSGDSRASETLDLFLQHFPQHPRKDEARLALAELTLNRGDRAGVARYLRVVNAAAPEGETAERAAYLAIYAAEGTTPEAAAREIELARQFIAKFPRSSLLAEVRMKLGQVYFQIGDHANAETQFTLLAREDPASGYAETALFLAGQAATKWIDAGAVDRALALFEEVVKRDGPLKLYARQQQAIVQSKLGKENEAVTIYEAILATLPPPELELRCAALCGKGDNLALLGRKTPASLEAAIAIYDALAALPEVPAVWRNQALYKKGRAFEQLQRVPEALTAYYDVLEKSTAGSAEYFWYYKAGFDAAALFEKQENWKSAIGIYQKMLRLAGPRAIEVKARLTQLRLEKFIWE